MKYLITKRNRVKIFPDNVSHSSMAQPKDIKSAGKIKMDSYGGIQVYGKSLSTGIKSNPNDTQPVMKELQKVIRKQFFI